MLVATPYISDSPHVHSWCSPLGSPNHNIGSPPAQKQFEKPVLVRVVGGAGGEVDLDKVDVSVLARPPSQALSTLSSSLPRDLHRVVQQKKTNTNGYSVGRKQSSKRRVTHSGRISYSDGRVVYSNGRVRYRKPDPDTESVLSQSDGIGLGEVLSRAAQEEEEDRRVVRRGVSEPHLFLFSAQPRVVYTTTPISPADRGMEDESDDGSDDEPIPDDWTDADADTNPPPTPHTSRQANGVPPPTPQRSRQANGVIQNRKPPELPSAHTAISKNDNNTSGQIPKENAPKSSKSARSKKSASKTRNRSAVGRPVPCYTYSSWQMDILKDISATERRDVWNAAPPSMIAEMYDFALEKKMFGSV